MITHFCIRLGVATACSALALSGIGCEAIPILGRAPDPFAESSASREESLSNEPAAVYKSRQHISAGRIAEARSILVAHLKQSPPDSATIELLAETALLTRDWRLHRAALVQRAELHADSGTIQNRTGLQLLQSARLQLADRSHLPESRTETQKVADETTGDGLRLLRRAVRQEPHSVRFAQDLAGALVDQDQLSEADAVLTTAMLRNPTDQSLPITAARFYEGIGNWPRAVACYDSALRNSPDSRLWPRNRAMCHYRLGDFNKAAVDFTAALRGTPVDGQLAEYIAWGDACLNAGQIDKAQGIFDHIARDEKFRTADLELLRSVCRVQQGQLDEADAILKRALADWPDNRELKELASRLSAIAAPASAAVDSAETAQLQLTPTHGNTAL